jgi:hypothetical protein
VILPAASHWIGPQKVLPLRELERACPQGTRLKIYSERDDCFFRSRLYGNDHALVAEDRAKGRIFGVMAALEDVYLRGAVPPRPGARRSR